MTIELLGKVGDVPAALTCLTTDAEPSGYSYGSRLFKIDPDSQEGTWYVYTSSGWIIEGENANLARPDSIVSDEVEVLSLNNYNTKHQILVEVVLTASEIVHVPDAGTLVIQGKPRGAVAYMDVVGGLGDLTKAPYFQIFDGSFDSLQFTPSDLDADCSFVVKYTGWR